MKLSVYLYGLILFICSQCAIHGKTKKANKASSYSETSQSYRVNKIDSINNYYLIYAIRNDSNYKIIAKKEVVQNCNRIYVNKSYSFLLHSMLYVKGKNIIPEMSRNEIHGLAVDDSTFILFDKSSNRDLYYAENIKGLCFLDN